MKIRFNMPYQTGKELACIEDAVEQGRLSGNGRFTKKCQSQLSELTGSSKVLLTTSCTDALEMCAILIDIKPGDEVIIPSYTFVSTANAFILRGAKVVFADSRTDHPGIDEDAVEELITDKTKAIVVVHYAGVACNMAKLKEVSDKHHVFLIEDAAQGIASDYHWPDGSKSALGSIGHLGTFSFHETKNIQCGEGGALLINDQRFAERAEVIWEKGTNRAAFWRGEVDKYGWVDIGSSFLPSELSAAFLSAQLDGVEEIQKGRKQVWNRYNRGFEDSVKQGLFSTPKIPNYASNNAHMFYLICSSTDQRTNLIEHLKRTSIHAVFHYISLHESAYFRSKHDLRELPNSEIYTNRLVRLPLHLDLTDEQIDLVIDSVKTFFK